MVLVLTSDNAARALFMAMTAIIFLAAPAGTHGPAASAQNSSAAATPVIADPAECLIEPRPREDFMALTEATPGVLQSEIQGIAVATPIMPTGGVPADPSIVAAVTETVEESVACLNAGDIARFTALYTDEAFFLAYGGGEITDPELAEQQLASLATPQPLPPDERVGIPAIRDVRVLPDGRVTAIISTTDGESLAVLSRSDGRYLYDWSYDLSTAATPEPQ
jgi:hypothetical protein